MSVFGPNDWHVVLDVEDKDPVLHKHGRPVIQPGLGKEAERTILASRAPQGDSLPVLKARVEQMEREQAEADALAVKELEREKRSHARMGR